MTKTKQLIETIRNLPEEQLDLLLNVAVRMRGKAAYYSLPENIKKEIDLGIAEDRGDDHVTLSDVMNEVKMQSSAGQVHEGYSPSANSTSSIQRADRLYS